MRYSLLAIVCLALASCKDKKVDLSGDKPVKVNDFIAAFHVIQPPYTAADTNLTKIADTVSISPKVLGQFVPDSIINSIIGKEQKVVINPVGRIEKDKETYLLANFAFPKKTELTTFVLDNKNKFLAYKPLLSSNNNDDYLHTVLINREPTFIVGRERMNSEKQLLQYSRTGWAYYDGIGFNQAVHESNEDEKKNSTIINPIDTLAKKNKYSGNYMQDEKNFITLRDGKTPNSYWFFVHFEKSKGECIGELKGEMQMKTANTAIYTASGDPCVVDFSFNGNEISVKEKGTCGNHRDIKCFFRDTYTKKKEAAPKKKK